MIMDAHLLLCDAQTVNSTDVSANIIDLGPLTANTARDIGSGEELYLVVSAASAFSASTAATLTVTLQTHSASGFSANTVLFSNAALSSGTLATTGPHIITRLPISDSWARYIRLSYTVATGPFTAGTLDAFIVKNISQSAKLMGFKQTVSFS